MDFNFKTALNQIIAKIITKNPSYGINITTTGNGITLNVLGKNGRMKESFTDFNAIGLIKTLERRYNA